MPTGKESAIELLVVQHMPLRKSLDDTVKSEHGVDISLFVCFEPSSIINQFINSRINPPMSLPSRKSIIIIAPW